MSNHAALNYNWVWPFDIDQFDINEHKYNTQPITRRRKPNGINFQMDTQSMLRYILTRCHQFKTRKHVIQSAMSLEALS